MSIQNQEIRAVGLSKDRYLSDHCVQGLPAVPGTFYVALAREAVARAHGAKPLLVEAIAFNNIVFLNEDESHDLSVDVTDEEGGRARVTIRSVDEQRSENAGANAEMVFVLEGEVALKAIDIEALKAAAATNVDKA